MQEDNIVQFVCFKTKLDFSEFVEKWEFYTSRFDMNKKKSTLQKQDFSKGGFKYVSQHTQPSEDFRFAFMKGRESEYFPDHNVKVTQAGGYSLLQTGKVYRYEDGINKIMLFINDSRTGVDFLTFMPAYRHRNIYKAYFENCLYSYILEFFVKEGDTDDFILEMKQYDWAELEVYKEYMTTPGPKRKKSKEIIA
jgi:hypothetical protein